MDKLKKKIIKYFICCVFGVSVIESAIDSLFTDVLHPYVTETKPVFLYFVLAFFALTLGMYFISAFIFYKLINKAVNEEGKRQVSERNMQYSSICHDLKTPMTSVQGFAAALREGRIKEEEQQEIFEIIYDKSCYMNELVESLFAYSKLNTESYKLTFNDTDICSLVRNLIATNYDEFEEKEIELEIKIPDKAIISKVDEKELKRSISNLLTNSCKHNRNGAKVMVEVKSCKNNVYITIADDGKAISKEEAENIVKPFVSGNEARTSKSGSGLGLAISSIIITKHNGKLYVDSNIEGYTKGFVVKIGL